jgi:hypothetical protein
MIQPPDQHIGKSIRAHEQNIGIPTSEKRNSDIQISELRHSNTGTPKKIQTLSSQKPIKNFIREDVVKQLIKQHIHKEP